MQALKRFIRDARVRYADAHDRLVLHCVLCGRRFVPATIENVCPVCSVDAAAVAEFWG